MKSSKRVCGPKPVIIARSEDQSQKSSKTVRGAAPGASLVEILSDRFDLSGRTGGSSGISSATGKLEVRGTIKGGESTGPAFIPSELSLGDICDNLDLDYSRARSAMARGILPIGVDPRPGSGSHRRFTPAQAYHLALALKIHDAGVYLPLAGKIADVSQAILETIVEAGCASDFAPFAGKLRTSKRWRLEIGNGQFIRITTNAHPKLRSYTSPWFFLEKPQFGPESDADITVIIDVDLVKIAGQLCGGTGLPSHRAKAGIPRRDRPKNPEQARGSNLQN